MSKRGEKVREFSYAPGPIRSTSFCGKGSIFQGDFKRLSLSEPVPVLSAHCEVLRYAVQNKMDNVKTTFFAKSWFG